MLFGERVRNTSDKNIYYFTLVSKGGNWVLLGVWQKQLIKNF